MSNSRLATLVVVVMLGTGCATLRGRADTTKYRTAYRDETNPVTRYRDVPHSFSYEATKRTGRYTSMLHVLVRAPDVDAQIESDFANEGFDHDVTFEPAGVVPQRANLMTHAAFALREEVRLRDALRSGLDEQYAKLYCSASTYTLEQAAACAYLDPKRTPPAARAVLAATFGQDEPYLATVIAR
ncbi:MAG: putative lipoprotein [Myxococcales bacterium]|nr:putative lipoprotein [Myxococcales bacterium]